MNQGNQNPFNPYQQGQPPVPPTQVPQIPGQDQETKKSKTHEAKDFWPLILLAILIPLIVIVAWILISDLSVFFADIAHQTSGLVEDAGIDPSDKRGFENFARLCLIACAFGLVLWFVTKKN